MQRVLLLDLVLSIVIALLQVLHPNLDQHRFIHERNLVKNCCCMMTPKYAILFNFIGFCIASTSGMGSAPCASLFLHLCHVPTLLEALFRLS